MKRVLIITTAAVLCLAFITPNAFSWSRGGHGRGCGGSGYNSGNAVFAGLTQEQKGRLADLRQKFIDETYEIRSAMRAKGRDIRMLLETSSPDKAKLTAMSNDIMGLKKEMQTKRIDFILAAKEIAPGLGADDLGFLGLGFGKGRHFSQGYGGSGPCLNAGKGMGSGSGPCTWAQ